MASVKSLHMYIKYMTHTNTWKEIPEIIVIYYQYKILIYLFIFKLCNKWISVFFFFKSTISVNMNQPQDW